MTGVRDADAQPCGGTTLLPSHWVLTFKIALFSSDVDRLRSSGMLLVARRSEALIIVTAMSVQKQDAVNQQHAVLCCRTGTRVSVQLTRDARDGTVKNYLIPQI